MTNLRQLMLPDNIVKAVECGKFHVYAVSSIYEALFILTNMPIHDKNKKGNYKKHTLFGKIVRRLMAWQSDDDESKK